MAALTGLKVSVDRTNYSRYDELRQTVTVTVVPTPTIGLSDTITMTLNRAVQATGSTPYLLDTQTITLNALTDYTNGFTFQINLASLVDADGIMTARHSLTFNDYTVAVTNGTIHASTDFNVVSTCVEEFKERWLQGLPLIAFEVVEPVNQPQQITGVTITTVGFRTPVGGQPFIFTHGSPSTLAWNGGPAISITANGTYTLMDPRGDYLQVAVNFSQLPGGNVTEVIAFRNQVMSDEAIIRAMIATTADVERGMQVRLEPVIVVTRNILDYGPTPDGGPMVDFIPTLYDEIGEAMPFYKYQTLERWLTIRIPYPSLLKIRNLSGFFNQSLAVTIDQPWIQFEYSGEVQLVPSNFVVLGWQFVGTAYYAFFLRNNYVPGFWNYIILAGLREGIPEDVREYIAMCAAIKLLTQAMGARFGGVTGYSLSRDGVSESRSMPMMYAGLIEQYNSIIGRMPGKTDLMLCKQRDRYRGLLFSTL